jgi:protein-S-isoprenylcysteine O-methyltransferase
VIPGALLMITGLFARLLAFYTAKSNFTHLIQVHKRSNHTLVTNGIYSLLRHPSYFGFFYFAVGSMIFIGNFFCSVAYIVTLHKFFRERIRYIYNKMIDLKNSN